MKPVKLNLKNCQNIGSENAAENTPSDALVIHTSKYQRVLSKALSYTSDKNAIFTIGIKPSRPETGYGYIAAAEPTSVDEIYKVEALRKSQTWRQPSNTLLPAITIGMPESSYGTLIPSARQSVPSSQTLPASWMRWHLLSILNRRKRWSANSSKPARRSALTMS